MSEHASIHHRDRPFKKLNPRKTMAQDALCWCESGKLFKDCHYKRVEQVRLNLFDLEKQFRKRSTKGICLHPNASKAECSSGAAISSHTIQKNGSLSVIAEEGHVLTTLSSLSEMIKFDGMPPLQRKGVNEASTFPGFCNKHDTELFAPIENNASNINTELAFLSSYRAICLEYYRKEAQLDYILAQREADKGQPFWKQVVLQEGLYAFEQGVHLGLKDIRLWKEQYDQAFKTNDLTSFHHYTVKFDAILPFVMCSALQVETDFAGNVLQVLGNNDLVYEHVTINITHTTSGTIASLGFLGSSSGPASRFLSSFADIPDHRKANALARAAFELGENIYVRQSWWNDLPKAEREELRQRIWSGTPARPRMPNCLVNTGAKFLAAKVDSIVAE